MPGRVNELDAERATQPSYPPLDLHKGSESDRPTRRPRKFGLGLVDIHLGFHLPTNNSVTPWMWVPNKSPPR